MDSQKLYKRVGAQIKSRRNQLDMTQQTLARHLGISRASLANIETGRQNVLLHHLYHLADALDLNVRDLLPSRSELQITETQNELPLPKDLNPQQRAQIARVLQGDSASPALTKDESHGRRAKKQSKL
jgi:transcriptional regulator with XRE-family HTH domain